MTTHVQRVSNGHYAVRGENDREPSVHVTDYGNLWACTVHGFFGTLDPPVASIPALSTTFELG